MYMYMYVRLYLDLSLCIYIYVRMHVGSRLVVFLRFRSETCCHGRGFSVSTRPARRGAHLSTSLSALVCTPSSNVDVTLFLPMHIIRPLLPRIHIRTATALHFE